MKSIRDIFKIGFGPSSSHTIGPGRAAEQFRWRYPAATRFRVTLYGSLAATGRGHGTGSVIHQVLAPHEVDIRWRTEEELPRHPNGLDFEAFDARGQLQGSWRVYSIGGGDLADEDGAVGPSEAIYPLTTMNDILEWCRENGRSLWEYVAEREGEHIWPFLEEVWTVMKTTIQTGLENEGVLPGPLRLARKAAAYHSRVRSSRGVIRDIGQLFSFALAVAEENAAGGRVVTAPTCGAAGVLPAVLYFLVADQNYPAVRILRGLATAGLVANLVKTNASISGAEVGCQGEIGTACSMASAAAAQIMGGTPAQVEYAAEMAFEHNLGLTCDPIEGYVQIPCIERNPIAAGKAVECAVYALYTDGAHKICFDRVVETMAETGRDLQSAYRETGRGGLARTWQPLR
ncbi:MAG: L-serine ammonia-lyase [Acidobacteria bacterium]|nr:L-serine ammonia-lyase [Acidobacteriota bacterium]